MTCAADRRWTVLIPTGGTPTTTRFPTAEIFAHAATTIGCDWTEFMQIPGLEDGRYRLVVDETAANTASGLPNMAASRLCRRPVFGAALIIDTVYTDGGPDLAWLTETAAAQISASVSGGTR